MSMIRNKFDQLITMSRKGRIVCLFGLVILVGLASQLEFMQPTLPLIQHNNGLLGGNEVFFGLFFCIWLLVLVVAANSFLFEFSVASNMPVFRKIVVDNAGSVLLIVGLVMWLSVVLLGYLYTGMICLLSNSLCLKC